MVNCSSAICLCENKNNTEQMKTDTGGEKGTLPNTVARYVTKQQRRH